MDHDSRRKGRRAGQECSDIGIALNDNGVYCWTLDGTFLLDDKGATIPVAGKDGETGKDGLTPTINTDGYWEIDGNPILDANGNPIKAVGQNGKQRQRRRFFLQRGSSRTIMR